MHHEPLHRLAWYHLVFDVPKPWEVVAYKANEKDGQLVLSDRHGERMRIYWKINKKAPDLARCLAEAAATEMEGAPDQRVIREALYEREGWLVYMPDHRAQGIAAVACRHEQEKGALIYVIFPAHSHKQDKSVIQDVLTSYRTNYGADRIWAIFGVDVSIPEEMDLIRVSAFPAAQTMYFENKRGESIAVHRYGMASFLLEQDDLATFVARRIGRRRRLYKEPASARIPKHPGVNLTYTTRGSGGMAAIMARTWQGRIAAWHCPELERIYFVDNNAREKNLLPDLHARVRSE